MLNCVFIFFLGIVLALDVFNAIGDLKDGVCSKVKPVTYLICFVIIAASFYSYLFITDKADKDTEISEIAITKVYQESKDDHYLIVTEDGETYSIVAYNVYKGDSNYVVKKHRVNATKRTRFLTGYTENVYDLVVTDTNFENVPTLAD